MTIKYYIEKNPLATCRRRQLIFILYFFFGINFILRRRVGIRGVISKLDASY